MNISRLLVFSPLVLACAAHAADPAPAKSPIINLGPVANQTVVPGNIPWSAKASRPVLQAIPNVGRPAFVWGDGVARRLIAPGMAMPDVAQNSETCYAIRSYRFSHPQGTDAPKMEGYSTCEKANLFAKKDAVGLPAKLTPLTAPPASQTR